jgi:hypothetical protein
MIIGVLGLIDSGKGTVGDYLVNKHGFIKESFAASLKDAVSAIFDWPRSLLEGDTQVSRNFRETVDPWWSQRLNKPNLTPRWVLQQVGSEVFRFGFHPDVWIASLEHRLSKEPNFNRVITDVRFPNEIAMIKKQNGFLIEVRRGPLPDWWNDAVQYNLKMRNDHLCGIKLEDIRFPKSMRGVHDSEWSWVGTTADYLIQNDGSLDQLHTNIDYALTLFKGSVILDAAIKNQISDHETHREDKLDMEGVYNNETI